jgi:hypothetical protein
MAPVTEKSTRIKRPNLSHEGEALQRSVWAELDWVRRSVAGKRIKIIGAAHLADKPAKPKNTKKSVNKK